jgi:hypothetical protein
MKLIENMCVNVCLTFMKLVGTFIKLTKHCSDVIHAKQYGICRIFYKLIIINLDQLLYLEVKDKKIVIEALRRYMYLPARFSGRMDTGKAS